MPFLGDLVKKLRAKKEDRGLSPGPLLVAAAELDLSPIVAEDLGGFIVSGAHKFILKDKATIARLP